MKVIKNAMPIPERVALRHAEEQEAKNAANIEYVAMMTDVEIPTEEVNDDAAQSEV